MEKNILVIFLSIIACMNVAYAADKPSKKTEEHASVVEQGKQGDPVVTTEEATSPVSGTMALASNYMWRGISLSDNLPAVQGGLTYTFLKTGIYLNLWGSNVKFPDINGNNATVELDTVIGIANELGDYFSYDLSAARYFYPGARGVAYNEFLTRWGFYFLTAELDYTSNVFNLHSSGTYYNVGFNYDIPCKYTFSIKDITIKGGIGHFSLPRNVGLRSYNDYNLQISKAFGLYSLAILWTGTNDRSVDEPALKDNHLVATLTANF